MIKIAESLTAEIAKVKTTFLVFAFEREAGKPGQAVWGYSLVEGSSAPMIRIGHIEDRNDIEKLIDVLDYFRQQNGKPFSRVVSVQLQKPESEYSAILWQHLCLQSDDTLQKIGHLGLRSPPFFKKDFVALPDVTGMCTFAKALNSAGWLYYCDKFNEELEKIPFNLDMLDIYQVEAKANDYSHEINSPILSGFRKKISANLIRTATDIVHRDDKESIKNSITSSEKELFKIRMAVQDNLQNICDCLFNLATHIETIEKPHPELISIKNTATILRILIEEDLNLDKPASMSWSRRMLLLCLLDRYLEVTSITDCAFDDGRTVISFAVRQAVAQLAMQGKMKALTTLALKWDGEIYRINECCSTKGTAEFEQWLHESKEEHSGLHQQAILVHQLRICTYKNLQNFFSSLYEKIGHFTNPDSENLAESIASDYLDLFPEHFLTYNPKTFQPERLTAEGVKHLQFLFR